MLQEGRKRDAAANALLGLAFAASAAQSPKDLVRSGHIESPGVQLMSRMMAKRKEADRNLDTGRVSHPARNRKVKTFKEFVEETYLIEKSKTFSSREEGEKHHGGTPQGYYWNNAGSTENPRWRLKPKSGGAKERQARSERIKSLTSQEERDKAKRKETVIKRKGYEAHHITPTHHSAKLKSSMSDAEWQKRVERDKKLGIYHGHQPKNLMATKGKNTPAEKPGIPHRAGGAHEFEGKTKDIVSGPKSKESAITVRDLISAAVRKKSRERRAERSAKVDEEFKQMPGKLMNKQMLKLQKSQSDLRKGRQTNKKREREIKYDKQMKSIMLASKQDYNEKGESYGKFYQDPLKTGKIRNHRFRDD
jgi:hypothetical protein